MIPLPIRPLSRSEFAPFGDVIEPDDAKSFPINTGKCIRYTTLRRWRRAARKPERWSAS